MSDLWIAVGSIATAVIAVTGIIEILRRRKPRASRDGEDSGAFIASTIMPSAFDAIAMTEQVEEPVEILESDGSLIRDDLFDGKNSIAISEPTQPADGITPAFLTGFFKGRTQMQANRLLQPYRGRPMTVTGVIDYANGEMETPAAMATLTRDSYNGIVLFLNFTSKSQIQALELVPLGHTITVTGEIGNATEYSLALDRCRLH